MNFGNINKVIIFGGTQRVVNLVNVLKSNFEVIVISSDRLLDSYLTGEAAMLTECLDKIGVRFFSVPDITKFNLNNILDEETLGVSLGAPWIFKEDFISKFNGKLLNGHGARLPQDRGAGDFSWQIMRGLNLGYHLFHKVDAGIDTGNIVTYSEFLFPPSCWTPEDFKNYSMEKEKSFFRNFFKKIKEGYEFCETSQQEYFSTYFPRLSTMEHGYINWNWKNTDIVSFIRAFDDPYPGASTFLNGKRVFMKKVRTVDTDGHFHPFMNGLVYRMTDNLLFIATAESGLIVEKIYDENGLDMKKKIKLGDRFWTPHDYLDNTMATRVSYDAKGVVIHRHEIEKG